MNYEYCKKLALSDFRQYNCLKASLEILPQQIAMLKNSGIAAGVPTERVMHSVSGDDAVIRHIARIEQLEQTLANNRARVACIDAALSALTKKEQEMLASFYINRQRGSVNNLSRSHFTDRSTLYRRATRALERYILAYYGVTKS